MKIGVISDTHLNAPNTSLEKVVKGHFKDTDLILHAGDIHSLGVLDAFKGKKFHAVAGNRDRPEVKEKFPAKVLITVNGVRIGLTHGWGPPFRLEKRVVSLFEGIHCLVFGHSHRAVNHFRNGILFFNPGTFTGGIFSFWRPSIGLLTIDQGIRGEIIWL
jgi:putative phosphoesterase